jgi:hypothetical protein
MTWKDYQRKGLVAAHQTGKAELDDLRAAVERNLKDAGIELLSDDNRFGIAYQAALLVARIAIACAGYRVKGQGAHHTTFEVVPLVLGTKYQPLADYLDLCRRKRNDIAYDCEGVVSSVDVEQLINAATKFASDVEAWIAKHHPALG